MKKITGILFLTFTLAFATGYTGKYIWTDIVVRENIRLAQAQYPGNAEDALIAFLQDTRQSPKDRSHIAAWTLGMINSEKGQSVIATYYQDDQRGLSCKDQHEELICQYELHKALHPEESNWWPLHAYLNK